MRRVARGALENRERRAGGQETQLIGAIPNLRDLAVGVVDSGIEAALDAAQEPTKFLCGRPGARRGGQLVNQRVDHSPSARELPEIAPHPGEPDGGLGESFEHPVHLLDLDPHGPEALGRRPCAWFGRRGGRFELRQPRRDVVEQMKEPVDLIGREAAGACVPMGLEQVFYRVGQVRDRRLSDHARGALQRVRKPEHAGELLGPADSLFELERRSAEPIERAREPRRESICKGLAPPGYGCSCGWMSCARFLEREVSCNDVWSVWLELASDLACSLRHVHDRDVDLLDGRGLLLGAEFDLLGGVGRRGDETGDLLERGRDLSELPRSQSRRPSSPFGRHDRRVHCGADVVDEAADLLGGPADAVGQLADLVGDDAEALAHLAGARRLDRRVDGEDVRLFGQLVDDLEDAADLLRLLPEIEHVVHDRVDLPP